MLQQSIVTDHFDCKTGSQGKESAETTQGWEYLVDPEENGGLSKDCIL